MWWKILSIVLVIYGICAGMLVPLKSGIDRVEPGFARTGQEKTVRFYGYNTFFARPAEDPVRVWLVYDSAYAVAAHKVQPVNDTILEATFTMPRQLPGGEAVAYLNAIVDHPSAGASLLPAAIELLPDTATLAAGIDSLWTANPVRDVHVQEGFSFPYQNVIYESIRNTYYHVPMWFGLMFLFLASVIHSVRFLGSLNAQRGSLDDFNRKKTAGNRFEHDRRAAAYAEMGLLYGVLGLITGMVWANYTWGKPWSNDIKQLMTAIALLVYLAYFILRRSFDDPDKGARLSAVYNIFAFAALIPLLYVVPRMFASLHPGATGNPAFGSQDLDNTMRAVFYPSIIGWTLLGFWMAELRFRFQRFSDRATGVEA